MNTYQSPINIIEETAEKAQNAVPVRAVKEVFISRAASSAQIQVVEEEIPAELIQAIKAGTCVAFVGAGFSAPCRMPTWPNLLRNILKRVESENLISDPTLLAFLAKTIDDADARGSSELFDLVSQLLEDNIGAAKVEEFVAAELVVPTDIPDAMKERLRLLGGIPFKAILTTNFDLLIQGQSPLSKNFSVMDHPYESVLRNPSQGELNFSVDEEVSSIIDEDRGEVKTTTNFTIQYHDKRPIIQLHGTLKEVSSTSVNRCLVWTRTGYRKLLHQTPGYLDFMRTVLGTCTVLYLGFSFSDLYLNDLRGEVLSMLYGDSDTSKTKEGKPIGYAIVNDKSKYEIDFFQKHEGVHMLSWNTIIPGSTHRDFTGFDKYLRRIHQKVSFTYFVGETTFGRKILLMDYQDELQAQNGISAGNTMSKLQRLINNATDAYVKDNNIQLSNVRSAVDICYTLPDAEQKLGQTRYDLIITIFGEDRSGQNKHVWKALVDKMRSLPPHAQAPFIVYATNYNLDARRRYCLRMGAYSYATTFYALVKSMSNVLNSTKTFQVMQTNPGDSSSPKVVVEIPSILSSAYEE